ncbi:MAG: type II toxin-antitoxin system HicA family toxin [Rhizobiaceae bacterium]|nr:type II toxin-antitoxin system HicA family toxin [Rhizobiaceae bacterium]
MNGKQRKVLARVFSNPLIGTVDWADIESLLVAAGCEVIEGSGSRVKFVHGTEVETFHRPHPDREAKRYQVGAARAFLTRIGVKP